MRTVQEALSSTSEISRKRSLFGFVLGMGFMEGLVFNFLPVSFTTFQHIFHVSLEELGRSQLISFAGATFFGLIGGAVVMKFNNRRAAIGAFAGLAVALTGIGASVVFGTVLIAAFLLGFALVALEVVSGSIITDSFPQQRQPVFFFWGLVNAAGATAGPAFLGFWLSMRGVGSGTWRVGYLSLVLPLAAIVIWGTLLRSSESQSSDANIEQKSSSIKVTREVLSRPDLYLVSLMMFLHGIAQMGMISWIGELYQQKYSISVEQAAILISLNSAGFFVGRSLLGWLTRKRYIPELLVLGICALGGTVAFAATIAAPNYWVGLLGFTAGGVFISGDGPSIYSYTGLRFEGRTAVAFALMNVLGNTGAAAGPYLIGRLGESAGLSAGIWLMPVFSLGLAALAFGRFLQERILDSRPV